MAAKKVTVFCGSARGNSPAFEKATRDLALCLRKHDLELVYGGGHVGLMGVLADASLAAGVRVTGVIPQHLFEKEVAHTNLSDLIIVHSMHERKMMMSELGDVFLALPGGFGTLDEFFEVLTWSQLGLHAKPCGLLNVDGYFDGVVDFMNNAVRYNFVPPSHRDMVLLESDPDALIDKALNYTHKIEPKWTPPAKV